MRPEAAPAINGLPVKIPTDVPIPPETKPFPKDFATSVIVPPEKIVAAASIPPPIKPPTPTIAAANGTISPLGSTKFTGLLRT